jgi:nucleoside-diphosphate-sugar epimerase
MKVRTIITGATGMVGEGVLHECLLSDYVEQILVINRRACNVQHPKLKELIHEDFSDFTFIESELKGYNAAFLCMGITSLGASEEVYTKITYQYTLALAKTLAMLNPETVICYVSGAGTKQDENIKNMWMRVKGKTEKDLQQLPCKAAYMFRPGYIQPTKGLKNTYTMYKVIAPLYPLWKLLLRKHACTLKEIGQAMIHTVTKGYNKTILEAPDIEKLAKA